MRKLFAVGMISLFAAAPCAADRIEELDENRNRIRIVENCRSGGKTVLRPVFGTVSYLIRRKSHR
jgi:hypothetical protein